MRRHTLTIVVLGALLAAATATAETVPLVLSHSGRLFDGEDRLATGSVQMTFKLRKLSSPPPLGATLDDEPVWTDTFSVNLLNGVYQVDLGSNVPLPATAFDGLRFLEVIISGQALSPRMRIGTAPYAFRAADAATVGGLAPSAFAPAAHAHDAAYYPRADADAKFASKAALEALDTGMTAAVDAIEASVASEAAARVAAGATYAAAASVYTKTQADARYLPIDAPTGGGGALLASWEFDEDGGSTFADGSGNKVNLTATTGGLSAGSLGHSGNAVNFSGGVLGAGTANVMRDAPYVTAEAWVRPATALTGKQTVIHRDGVFRLLQDGGRIVFQITAAKGTCTATHPGSTRVGTWSHVSGYYNGREVGVLLDEALVTVACANGPLASGTGRNVFIGAESAQRAEAFVGFVDELRVWGIAPMSRMGSYALGQAIPTCSSESKGQIFLDGSVFRGCDGTNWQYISGDTGPVTWNFTTCGATGRTGPSASQCAGAYSGTSLEGKVSFATGTNDAGIQRWTVPESGRYRITTWGAEGAEGTYAQGQHLVGFGGRGAMMSGVFTLAKDTVLKVLVGQRGVMGTAYEHQPGGGGGGTFVVKADNSPLVIAGGGGGGGDPSYGQTWGGHGRIVTTGESVVMHTSYSGTGGANGQGGTHNGNNTYVGCGAGLLGDGQATGSWSFAARSFTNGGTGGQPSAHNTNSVGGFGGGAGAQLCAGGGGGYSGGAAVCNWSSYGRSGGGGSFNGGSEQRNEHGQNFGDGKVEIVFLR